MTTLSVHMLSTVASLPSSASAVEVSCAHLSLQVSWPFSIRRLHKYVAGKSGVFQAGIHEQWGGVVPRLAQEGHKQASRDAAGHL